MQIDLPPGVSSILATLSDNGHDAYAVGGCVRDSLMGRPPADWDIASSAEPREVKRLFPQTYDTGVKHGTVTVAADGGRYEVTAFRVDGTYLDGRRPESVTFSRNIEDDLSRRDFTMNAIAFNPARGFIDPFGGRVDIARKIIRCVGEAERRFGEDALRMLRAARFAAQLGFTIDPDTLSAIAPLANRLELISAERIREELTRLLISPYPTAGVMLEETGLLTYALRGRAYGGNLPHALGLIEKCPKDTAMRCALFIYWAGAEAETVLRDLRFDNKTARETVTYVEWLDKGLPRRPYEIKKALNILTPEYFFRLLTLKSIFTPGLTDEIPRARKTAEGIIERGECYSLKTLAVSGDDLQKAGVPGGKTTGETLGRLLDAVMRDPGMNEKGRLMYMINSE